MLQYKSQSHSVLYTLNTEAVVYFLIIQCLRLQTLKNKITVMVLKI